MTHPEPSRPPILLRVLLRLYPESFRGRHEEELLEFVREDEARRARSLPARARFWIETSLDLTRGAWRARRTARSIRHRPRSRRLLGVLDGISDVRQGARSLRKTPLVTAVIVATLGIGVGLNTAIFSVVRAVLLEPLPYDEPERLYYIGSRWTNDGVDRARHTSADLDAFRRGAKAFEDVAAAIAIRQNLTGGGTPLQVEVGWASTNLFSLLGIEPALGTGFVEDSPPGTLVLSHELWRDRFGSDRDVVGRAVRLDDHPYTVAGVLPRGFQLLLPRFASHIDVWKTPDDRWQNGDVWDADGMDFALLNLVGRLDEHATVVQAQSEMDAFARAFREERIHYERAGVEYEVVRLDETVVGELRPTLLMLFAAVGIVLLIACANVMNLLLARSFARGHEIALRLALGGSRTRIARLLLAESLVLALLGGLTGIAVAVVATDVLQRLRPENLPRFDGVTLDGSVLAFALLVSVLSTVVFGLAPALGAARNRLARDVQSSRITASRSRQRLSRGLVVAQLSLSLVLLIGAGLLTKSLVRLAKVEPGFDSDRLLTFAVSLPGTKYERPHGTDRFLRELEERIENLPGARRAGVVWPLPLSGRAWSNTYTGGAVEAEERAYAQYRLATPGYFDAMRIPLLRGRGFSPGDVRHVAVISEQVAARSWPNERAVGRTLEANPWGGDLESFEVVGVVGDVRHAGLREPPRDTIYFDSRGWSWTDWEVDVVVHSEGAPSSLVEPIREQILSMDPTIPMARVRTMNAYVEEHLAGNRFALALIGLFAVAAGALASVGLYGVLSYSVSQRSKEFGLRMALGADRARILSRVLAQGAALVSTGIAIGVAGALLATRVLGSFLYEVGATDPTTFVLLPLALAVVGVGAAAAPALRATRVEPVTVLRVE